MVSLFNDFFHATARNISYPPVNAYADESGDITVEAAVAGFTISELDVSFENSQLTITGKKEDKVEPYNFIIKGIATRSFTRTFDVRGSYNLELAELENGMLKVLLKNTSERKKIKILAK